MAQRVEPFSEVAEGGLTEAWGGIVGVFPSTLRPPHPCAHALGWRHLPRRRHLKGGECRRGLGGGRLPACRVLPPSLGAARAPPVQARGGPSVAGRGLFLAN